MAIFFAYTALAIIVGVVASRRGRSGFGWFLLAFLISPVLTGPLVLMLPRRSAEAQINTETSAAGALFSIAKGAGVAVLVGCLVLVAMFVISVALIIQHGGA